jgi:tetratricopeptide (TPR) repeat protein
VSAFLLVLALATGEPATATTAPAPAPAAPSAPAPTATPAPATTTAPAPVSAAPAAPASAAERLEAANALYLSGDFDHAALAYRALLEEGWEGPALHLNMGNALARIGARGQAMASWQRALRLDPSDADARANLELARAQNVDRLLGAADAPLTTRLLERTGDVTAVALFGSAWVAFWVLLWLRGRATRSARRPFAVGALLTALLAVAAGALLAGKAADRRTPSAVVVAPVAPVREAPQKTLKASFELHEGTAVRLLEARGDLARVRLDNGLEGWVASADLEVI